LNFEAHISNLYNFEGHICNFHFLIILTTNQPCNN